MQQEKSLLC